MTAFEMALRPLQKYGDFSGRAPRAEYWWFYLGTVVVGFIVGIIDGILGSDVGWLGLVVNLALIVPTVAVTVRRLHDTDRTGWWLLSVIVPFTSLVVFAGVGILDGQINSPLTAPFWISLFLVVVAAVLLFIFMVLPGTGGPNNFGEDPYGPDHLEEIFA